MDAKVDLAAVLATFHEAFKPRQVGTYNENKLLLVKARGAFAWHVHEETDDLFVVLAGELRIELRDREPVTLGPGQMYVVPRGVEHRPVADEEAHVLLVEPLGEPNTGNLVDSAFAAEPEVL
jgi:mannose-6-phosphate isomerase-like protein (cupin superfamily)